MRLDHTHGSKQTPWCVQLRRTKRLSGSMTSSSAVAVPRWRWRVTRLATVETNGKVETDGHVDADGLDVLLPEGSKG